MRVKGGDNIKLTKAEKIYIAENNEKLVYAVVSKFRSCGIDSQELYSVGLVGYAKALNEFDKDKNVKFSTYAINCIRNEILFALRKDKKARTNNISMETVISEDKNGNGLTIEDTLSKISSREKSLEDKILLIEDIQSLKKVLAYLNEKERYILTYRYGLDKGIIKTQKEIAESVGMSQANISKLEKSIVKKCLAIMESITRNSVFI